MRIQRIYSKCLGLLIHSIMLIVLLACGKPIKDDEKEKRSPRGRPEIGTVMDEEVESLSNNNLKIEKRLQSKTKNLSIRITPKKVLNPVEEFERVSLPNCGSGDWDTNNVYYDRSKVSWKNYSENFAELAKNDLNFKASSPSGTNINSSLDELIKANGAIISVKPSYVEIKLPSKEWPTSLNGKEELDIELTLTPSKAFINVGSMREIRRVCTRSSSDRPHGAEGGAARGILSGIQLHEKKVQAISYFEGLGYSSQDFEVQYELDVRFVSQY